MNRTLSLLWLTAGLALAPGAATAAPLKVVATLPDFAALAESVGGAHVQCTSLARGSEDAHFVDPRPSFIRVLNRADVLLHGGLELEIGWLPPLVNSARNPRILPGRSGSVSMAEDLTLLEVPATATDRSQGDVHSLGNPHYWLDPTHGPIMANHLARVFGELDPEHAEDFRTHARTYADRVQTKLAEWETKLEPLRGTPVLTYHKTYEYLAHRFGLEIVGYLEPFPGIEPSPTHLADLIPEAKARGARLILIEPFRPTRTPKVVADAIGAQLVILPDKVGSGDHTSDPVELFDSIADILSRAARGNQTR